MMPVTVNARVWNVTVRDRVVRVALVVRQGPPGPPGSGEAADLAGYVHTQASPATVWTINHNLGRKPIVTLLSTGGVEFDGQLTHVSINQAVINLSSAVAGTARCL
jgi:hypothetical protein